MCTAITFRTQHHYFGRNLDLEQTYHETVTVTPRHYEFEYRKMGKMPEHYAMIGMAYVPNGYPLYYDATNEKGLSMAGLNFPGNAVYDEPSELKENIAPFEFIPWVLGQCSTVKQTRLLLKRIHLTAIDYNDQLPLSPLHWLIADRDEAITVECTGEGLKVLDNPVGVLTNNPPFEYHMLHLADFMSVSSAVPQNRFSDRISLTPYSLGMGSMGLPGDLSSASRFVKAAFTKFNSICETSEAESISQFFHILSSVEQPRGCTQVREKEYEFTQYSSCCNTDTGVYYYRTYDNSQITAVDMHKEDLNASSLVCYELIKNQQIRMQN